MTTNDRQYRLGVWICLGCTLVALFQARADPSTTLQLRYLWNVSAHSNGLTRSVLFTPDATQLVSAGDDGNVNFIRRSDGEGVRTIAAHTGIAYGLALSRDGSLLASGGADGLLKIWRMADATVLKSFQAHTSVVAAVAFSPDGSLVASAGGPDNEIKIWGVADGELLRTMTGRSILGMQSVAFSPDGQFVAGSGPQMWSINDGSLVGTFGDSGARDVKFSPDGNRLTAQQHYVVWSVSLPAGDIENIPSANWMPWSDFSPDGLSLVSVSIAQFVWSDVQNRRVIAEYCSGTGPCPEMSWERRYTSVAFDPQMRTVALGTAAGEVKLAELPIWISNVKTEGTNLTIQWQGGRGPFQLESKTYLSSPSWEETGPSVTGSSLTVPITAPAAVYRIRDN